MQQHEPGLREAASASPASGGHWLPRAQEGRCLPGLERRGSAVHVLTSRGGGGDKWEETSGLQTAEKGS